MSKHTPIEPASFMFKRLIEGLEADKDMLIEALEAVIDCGVDKKRWDKARAALEAVK